MIVEKNSDDRALQMRLNFKPISFRGGRFVEVFGLPEQLDARLAALASLRDSRSSPES